MSEAVAVIDEGLPPELLPAVSDLEPEQCAALRAKVSDEFLEYAADILERLQASPKAARLLAGRMMFGPKVPTKRPDWDNIAARVGVARRTMYEIRRRPEWREWLISESESQEIVERSPEIARTLGVKAARGNVKIAQACAESIGLLRKAPMELRVQVNTDQRYQQSLERLDSILGTCSVEQIQDAVIPPLIAE